MRRELALSHGLQLCGGTDSGKTRVSEAIAARYGLQVYHYDWHDWGSMVRCHAYAMPESGWAVGRGA